MPGNARVSMKVTAAPVKSTSTTAPMKMWTAMTTTTSSHAILRMVFEVTTSFHGLSVVVPANAAVYSWSSASLSCTFFSPAGAATPVVSAT